MDSKNNLYAKTDCPFSLKLLIFLAEAGLLGEYDLIDCPPGSAKMAEVSDMLSTKTGKSASFPTVKFKDGTYLSDSDRLIDYIAKRHNLDTATMPLFTFYKRGVFTTYLRMVKKIKAHFDDFFK